MANQSLEQHKSMSKVLYRYPSLVGAKLLRRYKRFLADVILESPTAPNQSAETITIHCPNTGPMLGLGMDSEPSVLLSHHESTTRKYAFSLEAIKLGSSVVGCHSALANKMVESALRQGRLDEALGGPFTLVQPEVKHGTSRFDFLLGATSSPQKIFLEVKCVTLAEDGVALFPDTVSDRALKHVTELMELSTSKIGYDAAMVFVLLRNDCSRFASSWQYDPAYAKKLKEAVDSGVRVIAMVAELTKSDGGQGAQGEYVWSFVRLMDVDLEYKREEFQSKKEEGGSKRRKKKV